MKQILLLILLATHIFSQSAWEKYESIPLGLYAWSHPNENYSLSDINYMEDLGVDIVSLDFLKPGNISLFSNVSFDIVPLQSTTDFGPNSGKIMLYSTSSFSYWDAEGRDNGTNPEVNLFPTTLTQTVSEDGVRCIKNISNLTGQSILTDGPGYPQKVYLPFQENGQWVKSNYKLSVNIKKKLKDGILIVPQHELLKIKVVYSELENVSGSQQLVEQTPIIFSFSSTEINNSFTPLEVSYTYNDTKGSGIDEYYSGHGSSEFVSQPTKYLVRYQVILVNNNYYDVYIDDILLSDQRGENFSSNYLQVKSEVEGNIDAFLNNQNYIIPQGVKDRIVSFHGVDKPRMVDYFQAYKAVDDIIRDYSTNDDLHLSMSIDIGRDGYNTDATIFPVGSENDYSMRGKAKIKAAFERAPLQDVTLKHYFTDYPYSSDVNYNYNCNLAVTYFNQMLDLYGEFGYSLQVYDNIAPYQTFITDDEILYSMNLALTHGARAIWLNNLYSDETADEPFTGLLDFDSNGTDLLPNSRYGFVRNHLSPLLHGPLGIKLHNLSAGNTYLTSCVVPSSAGQAQNFCDIEFAEQTPVNGVTKTIDIREFHSGKSYEQFYMLANRPSQTGSADYTFKLTIQNFDTHGYSNWSLIDYGVEKTIYNTAPNTDHLIPLASGEGKLLGIQPTIEAGGEITTDEIITSNTTLSDALEIGSGKTVTVKAVYTINADITIKNNALLTRGVNGKIVLGSGATITAQNISSSLVGSKNENDHPKLLIANVSGYGDQLKNIKRKLSNQSSFTTIKSDLTGNYYVDNTLNINELTPGQTVKYKIEYFDDIDFVHSYSNEIDYNYGSGAPIGKKGNNIPENFNLSQNYPNPFNPETTIKFALPADSFVEISLYNTLGQKIKTISKGHCSAGYQSVSFNASDLASGMYIYRIKASGENGKKFVDSKKMILMK